MNEKISKYKRLEDTNTRLQQAYDDYYTFGGKELTPHRNCYKAIPWRTMFWCAFFCYLAGLLFYAACLKFGSSGEEWSALARAALDFFCIICILTVLFVLSEDYCIWRLNKFGDGSVHHVLFFFCSKSNLQKVQDELDEIGTEVTQLKVIYTKQQAEKLRENFTRTLREAETVNPQFKALFKIAETELGATIHTTLSHNNYGLPEDVVMSATVDNLPTFKNHELELLVARHKSFKITKTELPGWESCVTILCGYKESHDRIGKIVADAT